MPRVTLALATWSPDGWRCCLSLDTGDLIRGPLDGRDVRTELLRYAREWQADGDTAYDVDAGALADVCTDAREAEAEGLDTQAWALWTRAAREYRAAGLPEAALAAGEEAERLAARVTPLEDLPSRYAGAGPVSGVLDTCGLLVGLVTVLGVVGAAVVS